MKDRIEVNVSVDPAIETEVDVDGLQRAAQQAILAGLPRIAGHATGPAEVSVRITDDEEIHLLNREYRGVDRPTDVLSFSLLEVESGPQVKIPADYTRQLGDVVISLPYAERQAAELGHELEMELSWLVIHGSLQLLGYQHDTEARAERMEAIETEVLRGLGFRRG